MGLGCKKQCSCKSCLPSLPLLLLHLPPPDQQSRFLLECACISTVLMLSPVQETCLVLHLNLCDQCWILQLQGMSNAQKHAMYYTTLRQLLWWCVLMAIVCSAFLLLLLSTPTWIDPTYGLLKVLHMHLSACPVHLHQPFLTCVPIDPCLCGLWSFHDCCVQRMCEKLSVSNSR